MHLGVCVYVCVCVCVFSLSNFISWVESCDHYHSLNTEQFHHMDPSCYPCIDTPFPGLSPQATPIVMPLYLRGIGSVTPCGCQKSTDAQVAYIKWPGIYSQPSISMDAEPTGMEGRL